jgi:hypothetical protein
MTLPFKLACLFHPSSVRPIIQNLIDSGFGEDDALQDEMAREIQIQNNFEEDIIYQQSQQRQAEIMMEEMN